MRSLLICDRDPRLRRAVSAYFSGIGFHVTGAADCKAAIRLIGETQFSIVLSETSPADGSIAELMMSVRGASCSLPVVILSTMRNTAETVAALEGGAAEFIQKPFGMRELEIRISTALAIKRLKHETQDLRGDRRNLIYKTQNIIGRSDGIWKAIEMVKKVAGTDATVLLCGETGTGKELLAGAIHYNSARADGPYVRVNCAALPEQLLESELFGHERGAFTGADKQRIGRFELACGGTIFLDEIGDMSLPMQAKVLRVLQEREFERLGGSRTIRTDVRVIAATNKDLSAEREQGRFRDDLFYRINVVCIAVPPLRERGEDVLLLASHFLDKLTRDLKKWIPGFRPDVSNRLAAYHWPGNVRELENCIERAIIMADGGEIKQEDLGLPELKEAVHACHDVVALPSAGVQLEDVEKELILQALEKKRWIQKEAAGLLGVSRRVLNYKIRKLGITHSTWKRNI